jgi:hypothetical protein
MKKTESFIAQTISMATKKIANSIVGIKALTIA